MSGLHLQVGLHCFEGVKSDKEPPKLIEDVKSRKMFRTVVIRKYSTFRFGRHFT